VDIGVFGVDYKNLINIMTVSKSPGIQRSQWSIQEFGLDLEFINGPQNVVADTLSTLDTEMSHPTLNYLKTLMIRV
jgi:hypothetical protein